MFFNFLLSLPNIWEFKTKSFSASIEVLTNASSHRITSDFDLSVDGYFSNQVPWNGGKFVSAKTGSNTKGFEIRISFGFLIDKSVTATRCCVKYRVWFWWFTANKERLKITVSLQVQSVFFFLYAVIWDNNEKISCFLVIFLASLAIQT